MIGTTQGTREIPKELIAKFLSWYQDETGVLLSIPPELEFEGEITVTIGNGICINVFIRSYDPKFREEQWVVGCARVPGGNIKTMED